MTKRFVLSTLFLLLGIVSVLAQGRKVTGTVIYSADKEPVVGAYVEVLGTKIVVTTDVNGKFVIADAPATSAKVRVRYIGLKTVETALVPNMTVELEEEATALEETMVVAFGQAKKAAFTGSAAVLDASKITATQTANVTDAFSGQVAGVQAIKTTGRPGEGSSIYIRGIGSFSASNAPLYIVDGNPYAGDIAAINPQDIASMTVMKDAAANALYGARGANGVIIITTKKGQRGDARVTFDAKWGSNSKATREYEVMTNANTYMETLYQAMYNSRYDQLIGSMDPARAAQQANLYVNQNIFSSTGLGVGYQMYAIPEGQNFIGMNGRVNPGATLGNVIDGYYYTADDWGKELIKNGNLRQEYNLNVSGGTEKVDYLVSFGYIDDNGIIPKSGFERFTLRAKNDYRLKDWLRGGVNVNFTHYKYNDPDGQSGTGSSSNVFYVANNIAPIYSLYVRDASGRIMYDSKGFPVYEYGDRTSSAVRRSFMPGSNPGSDLNLDQNYALSNILDGNVYAEADIYHGLKARVSYNYFIDDSRINSLVNPYYGQYSYMGGTVSVGHQRQTSTNLQTLLTYKETFRDKHTLDLLLGHELYSNKIASLSGQKNNIFKDDVPELDNAISNPYTSSSVNSYATQGIFFRGQYDYMERYFTSFSIRADGSSRFNPNGGKRWGTFWSIGGAWLISREDFFKAKWVDLLKVKASFGEQGNDNIGNYYAWSNQYQIVDVNDQVAITQGYTANPNISWEKSRNFNIGLDFELFKGRLTGTIEWFNRQTSDMLYARPMALSNGISMMWTNIGSVANRGLEIDLNGVLFRTKDVNIAMNVNATSLKNKIISLAPELHGRYIDGSYLRREGGPMYNMYLREWAGVDPATGQATWWKDITDTDGKVIGQEKTTKWDEATQREQGDVMPTMYGGFGVNANFYGFDFNINFAYQVGGRMYDSGYANLMHNGNTGAGENWHRDILRAWTPENVNTDVPRLSADATASYGNYTSTRFLISSNYLSLNNISIGYTIPQRYLKRLKIDRLRLYCAASNVALWAHRDGVDPRRAFLSNGNSEYSLIRTISGGISVDF